MNNGMMTIFGKWSRTSGVSDGICLMSLCRTVMAVVMLAVAWAGMAAGENDDAGDVPVILLGAEKQTAMTSVTSGYSGWNTVLINGKLHADGLPLSPSMKIFMEKGRRIMISIRAPFVGEVGRAEIDRDSIMLVNKMKKVYVKESLSTLPENFPAGLDDIQCLLLGRIAIGGYGELDADNASLADFYPEAGGGWLIVPKEVTQPYGASYGYLTMADGRLQAFMATAAAGDDVATIIYGYSGLSTELMLSLRNGRKERGAEIELDLPKWGARAFEPVSVNSKYRRTDFSGFFKSF